MYLYCPRHLFPQPFHFNSGGGNFFAGQQFVQFVDEHVHICIAIGRLLGKRFEQHRFDILGASPEHIVGERQGFTRLLDQYARRGIGFVGTMTGDHFVEDHPQVNTGPIAR